ncbi:MAG TPA: vitamin K epoxide reductase family protein [Acidobacteriota bacterium]|nr:vitamin K epoxide reductase family protein [Acidobacteriota bacterium]
MIAQILISILGLGLALYAHRTQKMILRFSHFKPFCEFSRNMSCIRAFESAWSRHFGISNAIYGMLMYIALIIFAVFELRTLSIILASIGLIGTLYLSYRLYKSKNLCLVCVASHVVNIALFAVVW